MAIQDKKMMLNNIEEQLKNIVTYNEMNDILQLLSREMDSYNIEHTGSSPQFDDDNLLRAFFTAKKIEGRSLKTMKHYKYILKRAFDSMGVSTKQTTIYHLRNYFMEEKERGIKDQTLEGTRSVLCSYYNWLQREGLIQNNPVINLGPIKCIKRVKPCLSSVDIERLKENCTNDRDKAIVCFLLSTGCRISEVTGANIEDINFQKMSCRVVGKGDKERIVYLDEVTTMVLLRYLNSRTDNSKALFVGKGTDRMKPGGIRLMLNKLADRAGVEHVHPHRFRRTLATNLINRGMAIQEVAHILGHDKLDTTMKYVYIEEENVKNHYKQCA